MKCSPVLQLGRTQCCAVSLDNSKLPLPMRTKYINTIPFSEGVNRMLAFGTRHKNWCKCNNISSLGRPCNQIRHCCLPLRYNTLTLFLLGCSKIRRCKGDLSRKAPEETAEPANSAARQVWSTSTVGSLLLSGPRSGVLCCDCTAQDCTAQTEGQALVSACFL